tara:strand:- start:482 stop:757 length:276 start_codon:yes stop_codon:yes gene_type:complete
LEALRAQFDVYDRDGNATIKDRKQEEFSSGGIRYRLYQTLCLDHSKLFTGYLPICTARSTHVNENGHSCRTWFKGVKRFTDWEWARYPVDA